MSNIKGELVVNELHKPAGKNFRRRYVIVKDLNDLIQADLVEMIPYVKSNGGNRYILVVINVFIIIGEGFEGVVGVFLPNFYATGKSTNYTNAEMCEMHYLYGMASGNSAEARRLYQERHPDRQVSHHNLFQRIHQRLWENGSFKKNTADNGRPMEVAIRQEEAVLNEICLQENPITSTRKIAHNLNLPHSTVWRIFKRQLLYPYHIQRVQALLPRDFPPRLAFCRWMQDKIAQNPQFGAEVLFTDEASFSRDGIFNFHNNHIWAEENEREIAEGHHQQQFSVNYRQFLEVLPELLDNVPLQLRQIMYFMHDVAPAHFSLIVRQYLDDEYQNRWIGRGGPNPWPPRFSELNCLDFFFSSHLKTLVYATPVENIDQLRERIVASCDIIRNTPGIFLRVRQSMRRRIAACIEANGGHFKHLMNLSRFKNPATLILHPKKTAFLQCLEVKY
ncbi:hypothetical protein NQ317_002914 [Molorchus minor]|uniref:DUF4817 domain-containing protein n=1 Tax=Molorchus minor TaxID=1323400 RepID=A0ABQ9JJS2_9CUCU|nr:hypothetical protein NQ317_002914 [Molorchus minor]